MALAVYDFKDGWTSTGLTAGVTDGPHILLGGKYMIAVDDTGTANGTLNMLMPDGTYIAVIPTMTVAGTSTPDLPRGTYQWVTGAGITLGSFVCVPIPYTPH
jgi:hypothetical protein